MKKNRRERDIVLSLETSVQGGSISLLENEKEIDFWQGSGNISKSEDILDELSRLLKKNTIEKVQIKQIVISRGPGSFTGTRIGLAIALGLKKTLNCDICGVSVLEAMALKSDWNKNIIAAVPIGAKICMQEFRIWQKEELVRQKEEIKKVTMPTLMMFESFIQLLDNGSDSRVILYGKLYKDVLEEVQTENQITERLLCSTENLAYLIGMKAKGLCNSNDLQPIYVREMS